ncbi:MAG: hypothetical protein ACK4HD_07365 [Pannonibacter phragmitetus]
MPDLSDDHMHLLALARRAFDAEQGALWRDNPEAAVDRHGAACDALCDELQRQVDMQDGKVPVLEHPQVAKIRLARRMRKEIIAEVSAAIEDYLSDMEGREL